MLLRKGERHGDVRWPCRVLIESAAVTEQMLDRIAVSAVAVTLEPRNEFAWQVFADWFSQRDNTAFSEPKYGGRGVCLGNASNAKWLIGFERDLACGVAVSRRHAPLPVEPRGFEVEQYGNP